MNLLSRIIFLTIFFLFSFKTIAKNRYSQFSYMSHLSCTKENDSTLVFTAFYYNAFPYDFAHKATGRDSLFFINPITKSYHALAVTDKSNFHKNTTYNTNISIKVTKRINTKEAWFTSFKNLDSCLVVLSAYFYKGAGNNTYFSWEEINYHTNYKTRYNLDNDFYTTCLIYPKNLALIEKNTAPSTFLERNINYDLDYYSIWTDAIYYNPGIIDKNMDSISCKKSLPIQTLYNDSFIRYGNNKGGLPSQNFYTHNFSYLNPTQLNCPNGSKVPCTPNPNAYPPKGMYLNPKTGEYTIGLKDSFIAAPSQGNSPSSGTEVLLNGDNHFYLQYLYLTTRMQESRNIGGIQRPLQTIYYTIGLERECYYAGKTAYRNMAPRIEAPSFEYHVCAGDTLVIPVNSTPAHFFRQGDVPTYMIWDSSLYNASFTQAQNKLPMRTEATLTWTPTLNDINTEPHRTSLWVRTQYLDSLPIYQNLEHNENGRTILIYVHDKIESAIQLDSVSCGKIYAQALDTITIKDSIVYQWWLTKGSDTTAYSNTKTIALQATDTGWHVLHLLVSTSLGNCPVLKTKKVYVAPFLRLSIKDTTFCAYDSVQVIPFIKLGNSKEKYLWHNGDTTAILTLFNTKKDSLVSLTIQDDVGCITTGSAKIKWNDLPTIEWSRDTTLCYGDTVTLPIDTAVYSYLIKNVPIEDTLAFLVNGKHPVLKQNKENSCFITDTLTVRYQNRPIWELLLDKPFCEEDSVNFSIPSFSLWDSLITNISGKAIKEASFGIRSSKDSLNIHQRAFLSSTGLSCIYDTNWALPIHKKPDLNIPNNDTACSNNLPFTYVITSSNGKASWLTTSNDYSKDIPYQNKQDFYGPYWHKAQSIDTNGCITVDSFGVWIEHQDTLSLAVDSTFCFSKKQEVTLNGISLLNKPVLYYANNVLLNTSKYNKYNITTMDSINGIILFKASTDSAAYCNILYKEQEVKILPRPNSTFKWSPEKGCIPLTIQLNALYKNYDSYSWEDQNGAILSTKESAEIDAIKTPDFIVRLLTSQGICKDSSSFATIPLFEPPNINVSYNPNLIFLEKPLVSFSNTTAKSTDQVKWSLDNKLQGTGKDWYYTFKDTGDYSIKVMVTTANGCRDSQTITIHVYPNSIVSIPNAFTPNGDQLNDEFKPITFGIESYKMAVFSRWGEIIYQGENGIWVANQEPEGTYLVLIVAKSKSGIVKEYKQLVTLIRK